MQAKRRVTHSTEGKQITINTPTHHGARSHSALTLRARVVSQVVYNVDMASCVALSCRLAAMDVAGDPVDASSSRRSCSHTGSRQNAKGLSVKAGKIEIIDSGTFLVLIANGVPIKLHAPQGMCSFVGPTFVRNLDLFVSGVLKKKFTKIEARTPIEKLHKTPTGGRL